MAATIPEKTHPAYRELVLGGTESRFESFALKIMLGRIRVSTKFDPSEENVLRHVETLHEFFVVNYQVAKRDLAMIFHEEKSL